MDETKEKLEKRAGRRGGADAEEDSAKTNLVEFEVENAKEKEKEDPEVDLTCRPLPAKKARTRRRGDPNPERNHCESDHDHDQVHVHVRRCVAMSKVPHETVLLNKLVGGSSRLRVMIHDDQTSQKAVGKPGAGDERVRGRGRAARQGARTRTWIQTRNR